MKKVVLLFILMASAFGFSQDYLIGIKGESDQFFYVKIKDSYGESVELARLVTYRRSSNGNIELYNSNDSKPIGLNKGYRYSQLYFIDEDNSDAITQFTDAESVISWLDANVGKSKGGTVNGGSAAETTYDNSTSGLSATDVQGAIDEVVATGGGIADGSITEAKLNLDVNAKITQSASSLGEKGETVTAATLADGVELKTSNFPWHIKKGFSISAYAEFSSLTGNIAIGKGLTDWHGEFIRIDDTEIHFIHNNTIDDNYHSVEHGLTIADFVKVNIHVDNDGIVSVSLVTKNDFFKYKTQSTNNWNHSVFIASTGQSLSNVSLASNSQDLSLPIWVFGDSYFQISDVRVAGNLKNIGYFNFMLNSMSGITSPESFADLQRALNFGTPKYIYWALGMNDTDTQHSAALASLESLCDNKGIELILATVPTVPTRDKEVISASVRSSGRRYVDNYKAVGADASGNWYSGYLNGDGVHPNEIGARVLASQVILDFPEITQYGNFTANEDKTISKSQITDIGTLEGNNTGDQDITIVGNKITISGGSTIILPDGSETGDELIKLNAAAYPPDEVDGTIGMSTYTGGSVTSVADTSNGQGNYVIELTTSGASGRVDIPFDVDANSDYVFKILYRQTVGTDGWIRIIDADNTFTGLAENLSSSWTEMELTHSFTTGGSSRIVFHAGKGFANPGDKVQFKVSVRKKIVESIVTHTVGTTAERPASPSTGDSHFDTTLGYRVDFNGTNWVDALGQIPN